MAKLSNYLRYFGSNIVEGVGDSWLEAEMTRVEVDGGRWRWVHSLAIPVLILLLLNVLQHKF